MKTKSNCMLVIALSFLAQLSYAGTAKIEKTNFNSLIEESIQSETELHKELKAQVKTPNAEKKKPDFHQIALDSVGKAQPENIPVSSRKMKSRQAQRTAFGKGDQIDQKRLSQELKDAR